MGSPFSQFIGSGLHPGRFKQMTRRLAVQSATLASSPVGRLFLLSGGRRGNPSRADAAGDRPPSGSRRGCPQTGSPRQRRSGRESAADRGRGSLDRPARRQTETADGMYLRASVEATDPFGLAYGRPDASHRGGAFSGVHASGGAPGANFFPQPRGRRRSQSGVQQPSKAARA